MSLLTLHSPLVAIMGISPGPRSAHVRTPAAATSSSTAAPAGTATAAAGAGAVAGGSDSWAVLFIIDEGTVVEGAGSVLVNFCGKSCGTYHGHIMDIRLYAHADCISSCVYV